MNLGAAALHSAVEGEQRQIHRQQQHHHDHRQSDGDDGLQHRQQAGGGDLYLVVKVFTMTSSVSSSEPDCSPTPTISVSILGKYSI